MSIYFYSQNKEGKIRALTGVKCIIFPENNSDYIKQKLSSTTAQDFQKSLNNVLEDDSKSKPLDFNEEYDHFKCLTETVVGGFFHLRHLLLRLAFSSKNKHALTEKTLHNSTTYKQVIKYYIDYSHFHYIAYPFIESKFAIDYERSMQKEDEDKNDKIYPERIQKYKQLLEALPEINHGIIGNFVDTRYINFKKKNIIIEKTNDLSSDIKKVSFFSKIIRILLCIYYDIFPILYIAKLWSIIFILLMKNIRLLIPYMFGRLLPTQIKKNNTGKMPSFVSGSVNIDPVGFSTGKTHLPSMEIPLSQIFTAQSQLFWHILSRIAVIYQHKKFGWDEQKLLKYFQMLREFIFEWQPISEASNTIASGLDFDLISEMSDEVMQKIDNSNNIYEYLVTISISIFEKWRNNEFLQEEDYGLQSFVGCSYYHI